MKFVLNALFIYLFIHSLLDNESSSSSKIRILSFTIVDLCSSFLYLKYLYSSVCKDTILFCNFAMFEPKNTEEYGRVDVLCMATTYFQHFILTLQFAY